MTTTNKSAARKPATKKNLTANMSGMGVASTLSETDQELAALLSSLGMPDSPPDADEVIESIEGAVPGELELEAAVNAAETQEVIERSYAEGEEELMADAVAPTPAPAKAKKAGLTDEEKAAKLAAKEADKTAKATARAAAKAERDAAKEARPTRKHYSSKSERVTDKLGAELGNYTVLTLSDAALVGDELTAKQQETIAILDGAGLKVQNRMTMLLEFVSGKSSKLNEVIQRALQVLKADGFIKTGDKGNFHINLLAKPYSPAAARAMGNNTVAALRDFKVIQKNDEGQYVANPESLILMKINGMIGL